MEDKTSVTSIADMMNLIENKEDNKMQDENKTVNNEKKEKKKKNHIKAANFEKATDKKINRLKSKNKRKKIGKIIRYILFIIIAISSIWVIHTLYPGYKDIKKEVYEKLSNMNEDTFKRAGNTVVYDNKNNIIAQYGNEKYEYITYDKIGKNITNGYIAYEDKNYMVHPGIDIKAIARASYSIIKNKGEITQGGSTITQQVVKNNILTSEQTYKRKITEALCSISLEKQYNKNQIMEFYCNSNYYGNGCYGIEGACQFYFGKSSKDVSLSEAAMMIATSNLPNAYNPVADYDLCLDKRDKVLYSMFEEGYITDEEYHGAIDERPEITQVSENIISNNYLSSYALHCATLKVMELNGFQFKYISESEDEYEEYNEIYNEEYNKAYDYVKINGFKIYTSLDQDVQSTLQKTIDESLSGFDERTEEGGYALQSAAACVDNETNMVIAIVGGRNDEGYYNRGYQAERQSGSTIKPLLDYGPAINEGYVYPGSYVEDKKVEYNGFVPQNANRKYSGTTTVRNALLQSINTVAVQLYMDVKSDVALSYLNKMRFSSIAYADTTAPSISIGGFTRGVTVVDMAKGYSTLANKGIYYDNDCIISMINYDKSIDYRYQDNPVEVYREDTAFMVTDMLRGYFVEKSGAGHKYQKSDQIYAGKTGTTNDTKDVWFCGYSRYYTASVWIGYDTPKPMQNITSHTYPCEIFTNFMEEIHKGKEPKEFDIPQNLYLINEKGKSKKIDYSKDIYSSRPSGWDYYSDNLKENHEVHKKQEEEENIEAEAKEAVKEFEEFQITSTDEAKMVQELYNDVYQKVTEVSNNDIRVSLLNRLAKKWDLIDGELLETWNDAIIQEEELEEQQLQADNIIKAQESIEKAEKKKKKDIINTAEWYIDTLNSRTIYTDYVAELIDSGKEAIKRASIYPDEYDDLSDRFDKAVTYAENLPLETEDEEIEE